VNAQLQHRTGDSLNVEFDSAGHSILGNDVDRRP